MSANDSSTQTSAARPPAQECRGVDPSLTFDGGEGPTRKTGSPGGCRRTVLVQIGSHGHCIHQSTGRHLITQQGCRHHVDPRPQQLGQLFGDAGHAQQIVPTTWQQVH